MSDVDRTGGLFLVDTRSTVRRAALLFALVFLLALPLYRAYSVFRADRTVRSDRTIEAYTRAIALDGTNADYWWLRGRWKHYSISQADVSGAMADYRRALQLNPRLGFAWLDLADCLERTGEEQEAERCLQQAFRTRTYSPVVRWAAGNFYLRRGDLPQMYACFRIAAEYDIEKIEIAAQLAWRVDSDQAAILRKLVPDNLRANLRYVDFLVERNQLDLARAAWQRSLDNAIPPQFEYKPAVAFRYIDHLLSADRVSDAQVVWKEVLHKAGLQPEALQAGSASANLVWNGSFESEFLQGGFDWRSFNSNAAQFQLDSGTHFDGLRSLQAVFGGANDALGSLSQIVPLPHAGAYSLECAYRTEGLTSDQTPYLAVEGYPEAGRAAARSPSFPSSADWTKRTVAFVVGPDCRAIRLVLRRDPSRRFDNLLKGSLWLDAIAIRPAASDTQNAPGQDAGDSR